MARRAGEILMDHYQSYAQDAASLAIETKDDNSPVTAADMASHEYLVRALTAFTPDIPILSEENKEQPDISGGLFWSIDPLDGTKGFIKQSGHFAVKITLMQNFEPVIGVVFEPAYNQLYFASRDSDAYMIGNDGVTRQIQARKADLSQGLTTLFNGIHYSQASYDALRDKLKTLGLDVPNTDKAQGGCKTMFYMAVARGEADLYMNCGQNTDLKNGNGYSWDYGPDTLIMRKAGGVIIDITTGLPPTFTAPTKNMNAMIGLGDRTLGETLFPSLKRK
jgi:3'(2'), 5'-bisphosphate nucleotidase